VQENQASAIPAAPNTGVNVSASNSSAQQVASLPTIYELRAKGSITLPELHLDIHVYSEVPEDRFVFINMSKQREKSQLSEGPTVDEITPDGVVLDYRGTTFLLPRD
jgi:general secretion pathway protein B